MYHVVEDRVKAALREFIARKYGLEVLVVTQRPPRLEMGEVASPVCFELAKKLKRAPRQIAQEIAAGVGRVEGVARWEVAGGGFLNAFLEWGAFFRSVFTGMMAEPKRPAADAPKVVVEHTNINPNKAAHIGHLRNAALGDTFVRLLRASGGRVEVQNYIDNTGVQVADVVVGFQQMEKRSPAEVRALSQEPRFDYHCWDLYARVTQFYEEDKAREVLRGETLKAIEEGRGDAAEIAEIVSTAIVRCHLRTMGRLGVQYDLLPRESEVLRLKFWEAAFERLKQKGAIELATTGKNRGCWVMRLGDGEGEETGDEDTKIIVRSNGTVTYVGKDIAYQLWKFGLLGKDFQYRRFETAADGHVVWISAAEAGDKGAPEFGRATRVYNVIDSRQAYLQRIVIAGLRALGYAEQADRSVHFSYEMVALSPRCAREMGYTLSEEDTKKPHIEVSGRKGLGVKADDLIDRLEAASRAEVDHRHPQVAEVERERMAHAIAIGALRYFLLRFARNTVIAFDFKDALSFEGETGPYCQYAVVRIRNIFRKWGEQTREQAARAEGHLAKGAEGSGEAVAHELARASDEELHGFLAAPGGNEFWEMVLLAGSLGATMRAAVSSQEPAFVAKYAFQLAQAFNNFYHKHHILSEENPARKVFLLTLSKVVETQLVRALDLLGIEAPEKM